MLLRIGFRLLRAGVRLLRVGVMLLRVGVMLLRVGEASRTAVAGDGILTRAPSLGTLAQSVAGGSLR